MFDVYLLILFNIHLKIRSISYLLLLYSKKSAYVTLSQSLVSFKLSNLFLESINSTNSKIDFPNYFQSQL